MSFQLKQYFPFLDWMGSYDRANLRGDALAGLTTAIMLIPQGMAYAMLAGLDPIIGLYSSIVPLIAYSLFGTSRELAVGPVAMVSLLVASGVGALAGNPAEYLMYAVMLSVMVGAMQLFMGVARLGFLVNFLSHPVISGFTSAAALIIGFSQLKHLLGFKIPRSHHIHTILLTALENIGKTSLPTIGIGVVSIVLLVVLKKKAPNFPRALLVVVLGTLFTWGMGFTPQEVAIVGKVPPGLPPVAVPTVTMEGMTGLLPIALTIALVGFMESISVAKAFARRAKYEVDANQELVGLGMANLAGSFFSAYPVTGGFSRTAVNAQAGARSGLAPIITAIIIAIALMFLTPLFYYLPNAVLAAIIMTAVFGLIDTDEVKHLWHVNRGDLALLALTFFATLSAGIEIGIGVGVAASLMWFVVRTTRPHYAVLGRLPGTRDFRNVKNYPEAETTPDLLAIRIDAQLYFGNVLFLKEIFKAEEARMVEAGQTLRAVVFDASGNNQLDASADVALHELVEEYGERGIPVYFASVKRPVYAAMERSHLVERITPARFFFNCHDAVEAATEFLNTPPATPEPEDDDEADPANEAHTLPRAA